MTKTYSKIRKKRETQYYIVSKHLKKKRIKNESVDTDSTRNGMKEKQEAKIRLQNANQL